MIPIIKTKERFGKFAGKEKYQGVLQHVRLYSTYGFHIKKACWQLLPTRSISLKDKVCLRIFMQYREH
jgi:hypothetical protein